MQLEVQGGSAPVAKHRWYTRPAIAGTAVAATILCVPLTFYFGWTSLRVRELCWYASPPRPLVQRGQDPTPLDVRFSGRPIEHDVYVLQVQVWNAGRLEIEASDVLSPVILQVRDGSHPATILDAKVLSSTRPETHFALSPPIETEAGKVSFSWRILERRDGGLVQLVCATESAPTVSISGSIKGQRLARNVQSRATRSGLQEFLQTLGFLVPGLLLSIFVIKFGGLVWRTSWRRTVKGYLAVGFGVVVAFTLLIGLMSFFMPPLPPFGW